jgi:hypothetical protein
MPVLYRTLRNSMTSLQLKTIVNQLPPGLLQVIENAKKNAGSSQK